MSPTLSLSDLTAMDYVVVNGKAVRRTAAMADEKPKAVLPGRYKSKLEADYAQRLATLAYTGAIEWWGYEVLKLRLADGAWYTPDFMVRINGKLEARETKGFFREAARVRVKVAAENFPWLPIHIVKYVNGQFRTVEVFNG